jgi:hypothetical protein
LIKLGVPRDQLAVEWIENSGITHENFSAEVLAEVVPSELRDEELDSAGASRVGALA